MPPLHNVSTAIKPLPRLKTQFTQMLIYIIAMNNNLQSRQTYKSSESVTADMSDLVDI